MKNSLVTLSLALAFGLSVLTTNVSAADSSGTYDGWINCKIFTNAGAKIKTGQVDVTVMVEQGPIAPSGTSNLNMSFDFFDVALGNGTQFDDSSSPLAKGFVGAVSCENDGEALTLEVVANAKLTNADKSDGKAKLKGTAAFTELDRHGTCKWKVVRSNTDIPDVPACDE